jgi:ABC-type microcin C transport system permease subunit YejB
MKKNCEFNKRLLYVILALMLALPFAVSICQAQSAAPVSLVQLKQLVAQTSQSPEGQSKVEMAAKISDAVSGMSTDQRQAIDDQTIDAMAALLADKNDTVRYYAALSLGYIGPHAARALPALRAALSLVSQPQVNTIGPDLGSDAVLPAVIKKISNDKP